MLPLLIEGVYYGFTGIWPIVSIDSFMKVTGPKTDLWLVKTVGVLVLASGAAMIVAYTRHNTSPDILLLALGEAFFLLLIDVIYTIKKIIRPIYLADAIIQIGFVIWIVAYQLS